MLVGERIRPVEQALLEAEDPQCERHRTASRAVRRSALPALPPGVHRAVPAVVYAVLPGLARMDAPMDDVEAHPPDVEMRASVQERRRERHIVLGAELACEVGRPEIIGRCGRERHHAVMFVPMPAPTLPIRRLAPCRAESSIMVNWSPWTSRMNCSRSSEGHVANQGTAHLASSSGAVQSGRSVIYLGQCVPHVPAQYRAVA